MSDLFLSALIAAGLILLIAFVFLGLQGPRRLEKDDLAMAAVGEILRLGGTSFVRGERLFDDTDYRLLLSNPALSQVAAQFRRDRQELILLWISVLRNDLRALWRFRRFLIRNGAPTTLAEEWMIFRAFAGAVAFLKFLRLSVVTFGPYAFSRKANRAYGCVETMSQATAAALGRTPRTGWSDLGRAWTSTS
jgi:hypothetical protein